jgi:fumarylacetoacetase
MTWLELPADHPFGIHTLPYCSFGVQCAQWVGVRIGDDILNLSGAESEGLIEAGGSLAGETTLDRLMEHGPTTWRTVREQITELLTNTRHASNVRRLFFPLGTDGLHLGNPFTVGDYVDFYSSEYHARNVGEILRPGQPALLPNWKHLPIGYHGRRGTVVVSGQEIRRPNGQRKGEDAPVFGPSVRLDVEAEVGFVIGTGSIAGVPLSTEDFEEQVFGVLLVNDWSARDIQAWEYQPLGPFLGKSFATSISPWVVPLAALEAARVPAPIQDPPVLAYLRERDRYTYDISLEISWNGTVVSRPPFRTLYWTPAQQLAHLTVNGAWVNPGDLYASGTVSGPDRNVGSFLELTHNGTEPVTLADGTSRGFLLDGDTVTITATAPGPDGAVIGFGEVTGLVVPAPSTSR